MTPVSQKLALYSHNVYNIEFSLNIRNGKSHIKVNNYKMQHFLHETFINASGKNGAVLAISSPELAHVKLCSRHPFEYEYV